MQVVLALVISVSLLQVADSAKLLWSRFAADAPLSLLPLPQPIPPLDIATIRANEFKLQLQDLFKTVSQLSGAEGQQLKNALTDQVSELYKALYRYHYNKKGIAGDIRKLVQNVLKTIEQINQYISQICGSVNGQKNIVYGGDNFVSGVSNSVRGDNTFVAGDKNQVKGDDVFCVGSRENICGQNTFVLGSDVEVRGDNNLVFGNGRKVEGTGKMVVGNMNVDLGKLNNYGLDFCEASSLL